MMLPTAKCPVSTAGRRVFAPGAIWFRALLLPVGFGVVAALTAGCTGTASTAAGQGAPDAGASSTGGTTGSGGGPGVGSGGTNAVGGSNGSGGIASSGGGTGTGGSSGGRGGLTGTGGRGTAG